MTVDVIIPTDSGRRPGMAVDLARRVADHLADTRWQPRIVIADHGTDMDQLTGPFERVDVPAEGKGAAVREALWVGDASFVAIIDDDGEYDPTYLSAFLEDIEHSNADAVAAIRTDDSDRQSRGRRIMSRIFARFVRLVTGIPVSDPQAGLKVFRRSSLAGYEPQSQHFGIDAELLSCVMRRGGSIRELGVRRRSIARSEVTLRTALVTVGEIWRIRWKSSSSFQRIGTLPDG